MLIKIILSLTLFHQYGCLTYEALTRLPTYCVRPEALAIFSRRFACLRGGSANGELQALMKDSASNYLRAHELKAHEFFVESSNNPFRVDCATNPEFEYVPILPLSWKQSLSVSDECSYASLINDILAYGLVMTKNVSSKSHRFIVASTFNLRTELGQGMPTQVRRGTAYDTVSQFVMNTNIGHYERWPQCPDLLRKSWKQVVEIPYLPIVSNKLATPYPIASKGKANWARKFNFFFGGKLLLLGPERICSVRHAVLLLSPQPDLLLVNITEHESDSATGVQTRVFQLMQDSVFCLILKGDSYSSAAFYSALHALCVPVVISDWFVFAFPWLVPYQEFVIRVSEEDFLKNPNGVLEGLRGLYLSFNAETGQYTANGEIQRMRLKMKKSLSLLDYTPVSYDSLDYYAYNDLLASSFSLSAVNATADKSSVQFSEMKTVLPFEAMLLEMRMTSQFAASSVRLDVPVYTPYMHPFPVGASGGPVGSVASAVPGVVMSTQVVPHRFITDSATHRTRAVNLMTSTSTAATAAAGEVLLEDKRSHLCKHTTRLIGMYKVVYFMQCVRVLWPLKPGQLRPHDQPNPRTATGLTEQDKSFVLAFHNISRPANWQLPSSYPLQSAAHVLTLSEALAGMT